ncbi:hypothetical protein FRC12_007928 [Ceratobasidium sp. 428]|nr:hypothetical protein FRC12_007928 [Ceratobasidium sp. 428]
MPTPYRKFDEEFVSPDWFNKSMSRILGGYLKEFEALKIKLNIIAILADAYEKVYKHEYRMHQYLQKVRPDEPIHPDPGFVRDGYKCALRELLTLLYDPTQPDANNPAVVALRKRMTSMFNLKLKALDDEYISRKAYYKCS